MGKGGQKKKNAAAQAEASSSPTAAAVASSIVAVGDCLEVRKDYLDMQAVGEGGGMANCGYLVLRRGEKIQVLYMGSAKAGDAGWLYCEVSKALPPEKAGRRGWCPSGILESSPPKSKEAPQSQPSAPPPPAKQPATTPSSQSGNRNATANVATSSSAKPPGTASQAAARTAALGTATPSSGTGTGRPGWQPNPPLSARHTAAAGPGPAAAGFTTAGHGSKVGVDKVFPALPLKGGGTSGSSGGGSQRHGHPQQGGSVSPASLGVWQRAGAGEQSEAFDVQEPEVPAKRADPKQVIASQRAAAAKAAAEAAAYTEVTSKKSTEGHCQICMEEYSSRRPRTLRPCCKVELCTKCDHKSLRSGRCYYCREECDEFPSLDLACRVAAS